MWSWRLWLIYHRLWYFYCWWETYRCLMSRKDSMFPMEPLLTVTNMSFNGLFGHNFRLKRSQIKTKYILRMFSCIRFYRYSTSLWMNFLKTSVWIKKNMIWQRFQYFIQSVYISYALWLQTFFFLTITKSDNIIIFFWSDMACTDIFL